MSISRRRGHPRSGNHTAFFSLENATSTWGGEAVTPLCPLGCAGKGSERSVRQPQDRYIPTMVFADGGGHQGSGVLVC